HDRPRSPGALHLLRRRDALSADQHRLRPAAAARPRRPGQETQEDGPGPPRPRPARHLPAAALPRRPTGRGARPPRPYSSIFFIGKCPTTVEVVTAQGRPVGDLRADMNPRVPEPGNAALCTEESST